MHSFGDSLTGSDCMNDDEFMTDDSDESVSQYKNTPNNKMYIVFNQKNTLLCQHYAQCFSIPIMFRIMPA